MSGNVWRPIVCPLLVYFLLCTHNVSHLNVCCRVSSCTNLFPLFFSQPPVPGMEDGGMSYASQQQQMQVSNQPQSPMQHPSHPSQHSNHPMGSGGQQQQQGGPTGGPHSQQNQSNASYNQQQHSYQDAAKPKKGQQLWNRMKREFMGVQGRRWELDS